MDPKAKAHIAFSFRAWDQRTSYDQSELLSFTLGDEIVPEGETVVGHLAARLSAEFARITGRQLGSTGL